MIRPASASDAEAISRLINALAHHFLVDPSGPEAAPFLQTLTPAAVAQRIVAPDFRSYVAQDASGIHGFLAMRGDSHLYHLFVRADAQRKGVGRALWEHAAALSGQSTFTVNASLYAVPMYERLGFVAQGQAQTANGLMFVPMVADGGIRDQ
ncbi:GNAT family N-acetyltransferase [Lysobacter sp. K5869]|uniref:GNAT family N-acetyltransferase n=1 Tax=Lysobacter sp. K5869 TaxID=2820808 RepID=UPI001C063BE9|nr:GNAT family N-acetyltransferase [Lysobacter sp. K5869]QWP79170.1 GNAT family N-acetyltransferase [Lysobacter sp. K5869]